MKVNCLWGVLLLVLAGCAQQKIEAQVKESLKAPESARFDKTSISPDGNTAGGVFNAKNSLGGYSGDQTFMVYDGRVRFPGEGKNWMDLADCCHSALRRTKGRAASEPAEIERETACRRLAPPIQLTPVAAN